MPSPEDALRAARIVSELRRRRASRMFDLMYPEETDAVHQTPDGTAYYSRHLYPRHMEFFEAGARYRERCARCANRVGKTLGMGAYEVTAHLTGRYPRWWRGRRFDGPISAWAAGKTNESTRDIIQKALLGEVKVSNGRKRVTGSMMVPKDCIGPITWKQGVADLVDSVQVHHASGGWSELGFKTYAQGRDSFEGTAKHAIWLDEEPPLDVYGECLIRTATTHGVVMLTFTPLEGLSQTVMQFMPQEERPAA